MAVKKQYNVEAWDHEGGNSLWHHLRMGTVYYTPESKLAPAGFGYRVGDLNPRHAKAYYTNGTDFVEREEIDVAAYHGLVGELLASEPGSKWEGVYLAALNLYLHNGVKDEAEQIYLSNLDTERKKIIRIFGSPSSLHINDFFGPLISNGQLFDNALQAMDEMNDSQKKRFIAEFMHFASFELKHAPASNTKRLLIKTVSRYYPKTTNAASVAFLIDSIDFTGDETGSKAWEQISASFGPNAASGDETLKLPDGFSS